MLPVLLFYRFQFPVPDHLLHVDYCMTMCVRVRFPLTCVCFAVLITPLHMVCCPLLSLKSELLSPTLSAQTESRDANIAIYLRGRV